MMRQLATGLMGNEGPGAGSRRLDAELNSVYYVLTMLYTFNMLFSNCDSVNIVKPGTSKKTSSVTCHIVVLVGREWC